MKDTKLLGPRRYIISGAMCKDLKLELLHNALPSAFMPSGSVLLTAFLFNDLLLLCERLICNGKDGNNRKEEPAKEFVIAVEVTCFLTVLILNDPSQLN